jgi:hypothetical protein
MIEILNLREVSGGSCYSQTVKLFGNDFTISIGSCQL